MDKIYKKGTVVTLKSSCNFAGCESEEEYTLDSDLTEKELNEIAWEFAMESIAPESWFEVESEPEDEDEDVDS